MKFPCSTRVAALILGVVPAVLLMPGCGDHDHGHDHAKGGGAGHAGHHHTPPHGGVPVELNEAFSLEIVADESNGTLKAYVLDGCLEKFIRLPAPGIEVHLTRGTNTATLQLAPAANPATGETVGDTALFASPAGTLKPTPGDPSPVRGTIPLLEVRGNRFTNVQFELPPAGKGMTKRMGLLG